MLESNEEEEVALASSTLRELKGRLINEGERERERARERETSPKTNNRGRRGGRVRVSERASLGERERESVPWREREERWDRFCIDAFRTLRRLGWRMAVEGA